MNDWNAWFAWHPVRLMDGRLAWLCEVQRRWNENLNPWCDASGWSGTDGGWEYSL